MVRSVYLLMLVYLLCLAPAFAGTGSSDGPNTKPPDADQKLRASVAWIMKLEGLRVIKSQRTDDYNEYKLDQSQSSQVMASIRDGLSKRSWKFTEKAAKDQETIEASKGNQQLKISLYKGGDEPRLIVEIVQE